MAGAGSIYPRAKSSGPQPANKSVFNLIGKMTLSYHFCVYGLKQVCMWDLMDFSQDSDKPILCTVQNAFIADS